ncbi:hypothetical protein VVD49_06325 [Uliginosibacterium sp. H3]|uniref:Uncharacterized protein n=1 Tax=Uliginosibacterium silvisoli TaxID=3114758 RepID=A0ABU6K1K3_9RHOO|nr:hypothetical protein [Uliginosibacterium sp. H3]
MRTTTDAHLDRVVEAIKDYLSRHPGAADSEIGVAQWWLHGWQQASGEGASADEVRQALERLQEIGEVEALELGGAGLLWRATRRKAV